MGKQNNEFLRKRPSRKNRNLLYDLSNFIIPVFIAFVGLVWSVQLYAWRMRFDQHYTDEPVFRTKAEVVIKVCVPDERWREYFRKVGYPFYNPGLIYLDVLAHGLSDNNIQNNILPALFPLFCGGFLAIAAFFIVSAIRGYGMDKADGIYGTARWGTEKDLKKFSLLAKKGVVLAETQKAEVEADMSKGGLQLKLKKPGDLICLSQNVNTLMLAPTRSGKGVGSIIPTALNFPWSMIFFDPKGELFNITSGFRSKFSHVLKFAPKNPDGITVCFNPLEEVHWNNQIVSDVDLIIQNLFEEGKGGDNSNAQFFNENAKDMIKTTILHVLTADKPEYAEKRNLPGIFEIMSLAAKTDDDDQGEDQGGGEEESGPGDKLFGEMFETKHLLNGVEAPWLQTLIEAGAGRMLQMNPKVRSDVFSTVFSKLQLFSDPLIAHATSHSDFKLDDFVVSDAPISLYLVVPFAHVDVIAPVFKLLINFFLRRFSDGETSFGEVKMKNRLLFLLDEFPVLGNFPFLVKTMGILAGYGINFYIICQGLNQLVDIYGQNHPFLDHCTTQCVYAPGKIEDAKIFTEAIGKESVKHDSISTSGSRYSVSLNNLNASSQEVARDLINPDELLHLPKNEALIISHGMPPYIAKKVVYYEDPRFKNKAYSVRPNKDYLRLKFFFVPLFKLKLGKSSIPLGLPFPLLTIYPDKLSDGKKVWRYRDSKNCRKGFAIPFTKQKRDMLTGFEPLVTMDLLERELAGLPSNKGKPKKKKKKAASAEASVSEQKIESQNEDDHFNILDYLESFSDEEDIAPYQGEVVDEEPPPTTMQLPPDIFSAMS